MSGETYHVHVEGGAQPFRLNLRDLWRYRDLIVLFTKRTLALNYKQTILGPAWLILRPLVVSVIYAAVFKGVAGLSTEGVPALLFYLTSHALWSLLSSCLRRNASTLRDNANIFGKVYFPRLAIPVSSVLTALAEFLVELALTAGILAYYVARGMVSPRWELIWLLPFVLLLTGALGMGLGILTSSLTTKYRDLALIVDFGVSLWMFASPVVYPFSQLHAGGFLYHVMRLNPMTAPLELLRLIVLGQGTVKASMVISSVIFTAAALAGGILFFNRVERSFIDTV